MLGRLPDLPTAQNPQPPPAAGAHTQPAPDTALEDASRRTPTWRWPTCARGACSTTTAAGGALCGRAGCGTGRRVATAPMPAATNIAATNKSGLTDTLSLSLSSSSIDQGLPRDDSRKELPGCQAARLRPPLWVGRYEIRRTGGHFGCMPSKETSASWLSSRCADASRSDRAARTWQPPDSASLTCRRAEPKFRSPQRRACGAPGR